MSEVNYQNQTLGKLNVTGLSNPATEEAPRERILFNDGWEFALGEENTSGWRVVDLPHDWGIEGGFDISLPGETGKLRWWGEARYRKTLKIEKGTEYALYFLEIEGAMSNSTVYVNGKNVGGWPYGYTSFYVELTPHLYRDGSENIIEIHLNNLPDSSRWYPGGGIYRNIWLHCSGEVHVTADSLVVATRKLSSDRSLATFDIVCEVENRRNDALEICMLTALYEHDSNGAPSEPVAVSAPESVIKVEAGASFVYATTIKLAAPKLWDVHADQNGLRPSLLDAVDNDQTTNQQIFKAPLYITEVILKDAQSGQLLDRVETRCGIRTVRFDPDSGLHLNHSAERTRIQGVCLHHDLGPLGAAAHPDAILRQLMLLRELGCNAIRCSHNPPSPVLLDLCDRMGFLVMDELCDSWKIAKKPNGYQTIFDDWVERDLRAMVRRDRNHPSVIMWSIGNEVPEQASPDGPDMSRRLAAIVRDEDLEKRPVTGGMHIPEAGFNGWQNEYDVFGYNYKPHLYAKFRQENPTIPLIGAETSSAVSTRGEYVFPVSNDPADGLTIPPICQVSSYDLYAPPWAQIPDAEFAGQDENALAVAGEFVWTGFDYLGEPTPFNDDPSNLLNSNDPVIRAKIAEKLAALSSSGKHLPARSSYFGILDLCGFPKDRYYLYQSRWRPELKAAHILPHWDWPERVGENTPVHVYSSGDEAELFLNGRSLGVRRRGAYDYRFRWDNVIYEPGELRVCVLKAGNFWAESVRCTTGPAVQIELRADYFPVCESASLAFVTAMVTDAHGQMSARANYPLVFELPKNSPLQLIATDNGDPTRLMPFNSAECSLFNGLALAIIRLDQTENPVPADLRLLKVRALVDGIAEARLQL